MKNSLITMATCNSVYKILSSMEVHTAVTDPRRKLVLITATKHQWHWHLLKKHS